MKSSNLEGGESLFEVPDNLPPPVLPLIQNVGFVGIVNSPPSVESVQFLPITDGGSALPGVLQGLPDPSKLSSKQANFTHTFLKSVLTSIDSKDPVVANAWLDTLLDVIDLLPKEVIREKILGLAVTKGQSTQNSSRLASCKLIGKISTKFEPYVLKSEVLGVVQSLCQDVNGEVRGSMCMQLAAVARGVGLTTTKSLILPELVDLCADEEVNVRLAGINTVVQMLPLVDQETRSNTLVPLVKKMCDRALRVEDASLPVTAHLFGRICHGLHDDLSKEQKDFFINFYCALSKLGLPDAKKTDLGLPMPDLVAEVRSGEYEAECRQQCAYNFPAMIVFGGGPAGCRKHLHDTLLSFITDPSLPVRNTLALSFHQLCTLIGNEVGILRESFLNLLRSDNIEVISALVPNISHILAAFSHHQVLTQSSLQTEVLDLVGALKQGEESISKSSNWRVHSEILRQIAALALCLPPDLLFSEVVPLMIHRMHSSRPIPCRQAAARTLLVFLRHMDSKEHRDHINKTLIIEFCEANSCHKRMLFLNVCRMALDLLPRESFKDDLFQSLLALHTDRVANIRLKLVGFFPLLKRILVLPEDKQRLQDLETAVGTLLSKESDKDVSALLSIIIDHLDKIEVTESKRGSPEGQEITGSERDPIAERRIKERENTKGHIEEDTPSSLLSKKGVSVGSLSNRRANVPGRIPSYVAAQRRRSSNFAPELPPDEKAVKRISSLDPSADEFLIDAGVRIDEASIRGRMAPPTTMNQQRGIVGALGRHVQSNGPSRSSRAPSNVSKIPVVGRTSEALGPSHLANDAIVEDVKTRQRVSQRQTRPISGVAPHAPTRISIGGSRGKSLSHENLRTSARIGMSSSSSAKTSPVSSRPTSPTNLTNRAPTSSSRVRQPQHGVGASKRSRNIGESPSGSRCSSPIGEGESRNRRPGSTASSPSSSRCCSPGEDDAARGLLQRRTTVPSRLNVAGVVQGRPRQNSSIPTMGGASRGRGSKLPLPTSKK